jgi:L-alanine-DL-glutamate epimerase-like enolase superfamily enzyme
VKITSVDCILVQGGDPCRGRNTWNPIIIRINTDEGISGYGEAGVAYGKGHRAAFGMIQDFATVIVGEDPRNIEKIWDKIYRKTFWGLGGGTIVSAGMSAIDIALWDIKGKALGVPVYQLLGGQTNKKLRVYASQIQFGWGDKEEPGEKLLMITPEDYANATRKAMSEGYTAVKVDPIALSDREPDGGGPWKTTGVLENHVLETAVNRIAAIREAGGPDLDIIIELHSYTDAVSAVQLGRELEKYRIFYYEEPCSPLNPGNMLEVHRALNIPIASGERIYGRTGFREFLEQHSLQIVQPDICLCGGLSEAKKISDMASTYDCAVQIHVCGSPIAKAAALHIETALPNFLIHEHHRWAQHTSLRETCVHDYQPVNGFYEAPDLPGIGQELKPETLEKAQIITIK